MGMPIARVGDAIGHGSPTGTITGPGSPTVQSPVGLIVAKQGDTVVCATHPAVVPNIIVLGSPTVRTIAGVFGVARVGDSTTCGATILAGNPTVLVGP